LYFSGENKVELHVYPFAPNELRTTGFQLIHREPIKLSIGNKIAKLGADKHPNVILNTPHFIFIPNKEKQNYLNPIETLFSFYFGCCPWKLLSEIYISITKVKERLSCSFLESQDKLG
jgi:hypothetical protein